MINSKGLHKNYKYLLKELRPVLANRYFRSYHSSANYKYRVTTDTFLNFANLITSSLNSLYWKKQKDVSIVELKFKKSLANVRAQAKAAGVDWTKAKYLRTDASNAKADEDIPIRTGNLLIHFDVAGKEYRIKLDDCAKTPRWGWMLGPDELQLDTVKNK